MCAHGVTLVEIIIPSCTYNHLLKFMGSFNTRERPDSEIIKIDPV
jgi:hypothetical protein